MFKLLYFIYEHAIDDKEYQDVKRYLTVKLR